MKRIFALIGILVLAVAGVSWLYFSSLQNKTTGPTQIIRALQPDALFAYSFYNEKEYGEIFRNNTLFVSVTGREAMSELQSLRNFVEQKNILKQAFNGSPVVISLHIDSAKKQTNWMLSTSLPQSMSWNNMLKVLAQYGKIEEHGNIYVLKSAQFARPLFMSRKKGIIAASFSPETVNRFTINTQENSFVQLGDQQNRNTLAGLTVNYRLLPALRKMISKNRFNLFFDLLPAINGSSATTITYNQTALLFNGVTYPDANDHGLVSSLKDQNAVAISIDHILPSEIFAYSAVGLSNYSRFLFKVDSARQQSFGGKKKSLLKQVSFPLAFFMKQQFAGEFAVTLLPNGEQMAFVKIRDGARLKQYFLSMSENNDDGDINRFRHDNFPEAFFGPLMRPFPRPYFAVNGEYLIMANSYSTISRYLQLKQSNRLLAGNERYQRSRNLMSDRSNLSFFAFTENGRSLLRQQLSSSYYEVVNDEKKPSLRDYESLALQFSSDGSSFYTNILMKQGDVDDRSEEPVWEYNNDARLVNRPLTLSGNGGRLLIALEDSRSRFTLLNDSGKKVMQKQLRGHIMGEIQQLGDEIFFTTNAAVYRFSFTGEDAPGYPLDLPFSATAGITRSADRFIVPAGNRVYAYSQTRPSGPVWQASVSGNVRFPVRRLSTGQDQQFVFITDAGRYYRLANDGSVVKESRIRSSSSFPYPYAIQRGTNNNGTFLITANQRGDIYRIKEDGSAEDETPGVFGDEITFNCDNILGDGQPELIYLDKKQLTVYDTNFNQVYNYLFPKPVKTSIRIIRDRGKKMIGVIAISGNHIYLFNPDGSMVKGFPRKGSPLFWCGSLFQNGQNYLITADGNSVKAYLAE